MQYYFEYKYIVDIGDYLRYRLYTGDNVFLAGLAIARGQRDRRRTAFGDTVACYSPQNVDIDTNGCSSEENEFFADCNAVGSDYKRRRPQDINLCNWGLKLSPGSMILNKDGYAL